MSPSLSFIFAVSVYFMSSKKVGRINKMTENWACSLELWVHSVSTVKHWPQIRWASSPQSLILIGGFIQHWHQLISVHTGLFTRVKQLIATVIDHKQSRPRIDCFSAMINSKKWTPKTVVSRLWIMKPIWLVSRRWWQKWTICWPGIKFSDLRELRLGKLITNSESLWHYWSQ